MYPTRSPRAGAGASSAGAGPPVEEPEAEAHPAGSRAAGRCRRWRRAAWWAGRVVGLPTALVMLVLLALHEMGWRSWEARIAGHATALITSTHAYTRQETFIVDVGKPDVFGLSVTSECTSALIVIGLLAVTAILLAVTRLPLTRLAAAAALSAGMFFVINLARLVMIALSTREWGLGAGYYDSHVWAGTFVTVFGVAAIVALYLVLLGAVGRRRKRARP